MSRIPKERKRRSGPKDAVFGWALNINLGIPPESSSISTKLRVEKSGFKKDYIKFKAG
jgi:hypothetical protein